MHTESLAPGEVEAVAPGTAVLPKGAPTPHLDRALASGLAWTGAMKWGAQAATWIATLAVARILMPADFGLVALSSVYMGVVTIVTEFGLGTSVIILRDLTEDQIARIHGFSVLLGVGCFALSLAAAPLLAAFFRAPELQAVVGVMSLGFVLMSLATIPVSLLRRDMRFKSVAVIDATRALIQSGSMVLLALLGFRYWTLVIGALVGSAVYTASALTLRWHPIAWPRRGALREAMRVSLDVLGSKLSWYLYSSADFIIAGRVLGQAALGAYTLAWQLASVPVEKVTSLVVQVTPAILAAVQTDLAALRRYLLRLTEGIALLAFPAAVGLGLVADHFVLVVLTEKYAAAILPLRILALYASVRTIAPLFAPILIAMGQTRIVFWNNMLALLVLPAAFFAGSRWGTAGIAGAWVIAHPLVVGQIGRRVFRAIQLRATDYFASIMPALVASAVMAVVVLLIRLLAPASLSLPLLLALEVVGGALAYAGVLFGRYRSRLEAFRRFLAVARDRKDA